MEDLNTPTELSYYGLYLLSYLKESHPDKALDTDFIVERADHAAGVFEQSRLEGYTPEGAQELAMVALMEGLHFSRYNTVLEVLWNEFASEVPKGDAPDLALKLQPELEPVFAQYFLSDDFRDAPEYEKLYTFLTGAVVIYFEERKLDKLVIVI